MSNDVRNQIEEALRAFTEKNLRTASIDLLNTLGYQSERVLPIDSLLSLKEHLDPKGFLTDNNALLGKWSAVHFLFQLTSAEIAEQSSGKLNLLENTTFDEKEIKSYLFFVIQLSGDKPTRAELSKITRSLNRLVPMPVFVLFKHENTLSLSIINRRRNLRDGTRDVLTRVSLIRDISLKNPHRAHLDILSSFSLNTISIEAGSIRTFADLDTAWQKILSTQELNRRFYSDLVDWFKWAVSEIRLAQMPDFVEDTEEEREKATHEFVMRLICRVIFAWFLKEKQLLSDKLLDIFDTADRCRLPVRDAGEDGVLESNSYYRGILQNIFFKALNKPMDQRRKTASAARNDKTVDDPKLKKLDYLGKNYLPIDFNYDLFDRIPYLNGGLFDVLPSDNASDTIDDGAIHIPNMLFAAKREDGFVVRVKNGRREYNKPIEGLNRIFSRYRFTVTENTALEEDVALDPELLGMVFENLLAEINPTDEAAAKTARKASGSYYTPRRIVDYMVNEALHLHLKTCFEKRGATKYDLQLVTNLCYRDEGMDFDPIANRVVDMIDELRVLDPACGSGAFPMGMLHRMVELLGTVDPGNNRWKKRLLERLPENVRADAELGMAGKSYNYLRKLGLIQKNLYGIDILPLAVLIAKLRFFLTLVIEQDVDLKDRLQNYHLHALPNIETNLLCCNTLKETEIGVFEDLAIKEYIQAREDYYNPELSAEERNQLCRSIAETLNELFPAFSREALGITPPIDPSTAREQNIANLQRWFRTATIPAPFFSVRAFFPEIGNAGFHIVIGNPPYGGNKISNETKDALGLGSKDPYGAFIARFLKGEECKHKTTPLAPEGVLAYIVSDTFMTIKTHRQLRKQMMLHRIHKMLRVHPDTFHATVNTAIILCQRGRASEEHVCQMADLTNVSIHDHFERFLHLLYQTEGFAHHQNISNQTYAIYHYRQSLIETNSNLPFFVASPKMFVLMNDHSAPIVHKKIGGKDVAVRTNTFNGHSISLVKLRDIAEVKQGLATGDNSSYLFQNPAARGTYMSIDTVENYLLTEKDLQKIHNDNDLRLNVIQNGISKSDTSTKRYFGGRYIIPYDKGGGSDSSSGWMPNYYVPTDYYVDWSEGAVQRLRTLTTRHRNTEKGKSGGNDRLCSRFQNFDSYFQHAIIYSPTGQYAPTFRLHYPSVYDKEGSCIFSDVIPYKALIALLSSKLTKYFQKVCINGTVHSMQGDIDNSPIMYHLPINDLIQEVSSIIMNQRKNPNYDYASNEQIEIDHLIYDAYGLNENDIQEVENWYARRYPKLAKAQRRTLAAKQGKTEIELVKRTTYHIYCDESRHLPYDREPCFLLGMLSCPAESVKDAHVELATLWKDYGLPLHFELKWTKVSPGKLDFYSAVIEWFFNTDGILFRTLILPGKQKLYAALPDESRDYLYYRLYYQLLRGAIEPENRYRIFMDLKDTRGRQKRKELEHILQEDADDTGKEVIKNLQHVHSHEIRLLQLCDLLLGAVGFANREKQPDESKAKRALVSMIEEKLGQPLTMDTPPGSEKISIITWHDREALLL
jgi:type I restriction-modification system DNA methylase subunit